MEQGPTIRRGRPAGQLTPNRRRVLGYMLGREADGEPVIIGQGMRECGIADRTVWRRTVKDLRNMGLIRNN